MPMFKPIVTLDTLSRDSRAPLESKTLTRRTTTDEIHSLLGLSKAEGSMDAGNLLKPALSRGEVQCCGATTLNEYRLIEKDATLARRFQPILVGEPSVQETVSILRGLKERYEVHHGVRILDSALVAAANLSNRYLSERFLPDKAIDLYVLFGITFPVW